MDNKEVIAIYDIRGIQNYIFRTNAVKEIIGASKIVDGLMINSFTKAIEECKIENVFLKWSEKDENGNLKDLQFEDNPNINVEVLYYGGGNLVVLFRHESDCKKVSLKMSEIIINKAYGLSLAYAFVPKTNDYPEDWRNLKERLSEIKAVTPLNSPAGVLPIVQYDINGLPLSKTATVNNKTRKYSKEAYQKIEMYSKVDKENSIYAKEFDQMRTNSGEGMIAIVHIDGNSMGANIMEIMSNVKDYKTATGAMREISSNIHKVFEENAIYAVKEEIEKICKKHNVENLIKYDQEGNIKSIPFRPIITAGDDITFVCNQRISLDIVKTYINTIRKGYMYNNNYKFSACAGIAIVHSHYPFYKAYSIAENACESAKKRAKNEGKISVKDNSGNIKQNQIGNYVDFQLCQSGSVDDLEDTRKELYTNIEGNSLVNRPYGIFNEEDIVNDSQEKYSIKEFEKELNTMCKLSRNKAKDIRDSYYLSESELNVIVEKIKSKNSKINIEDMYINSDNKKVARYFDALEFLDIYGIAKKENKEEKGGNK